MLENDMSYNEIGMALGRSDMSIRYALLRNFNLKRTDVHSSRISKTCLQCGKLFRVTLGNDRKYNHKFCSQSCSAIYNNSRKIKKKKYCLCCGKELHAGSKYCDNICKSKYERENIILKWLNNEIVGHHKTGSYSLILAIKNWVFERAGSRCEECGNDDTNPHTGNTILQTHHVDGDASNNRPDNLKILCPNCHAKTSTYGNISNNKSARIRKQYR